MSISTPTLVVFIVYLLGMLAIGAWTYKKTDTIADFFLGGRQMNSWVTAMSAQASDMSGWLLLAMPGAIYVTGINGLWMGIGLAVGTYLNWQFVATRLRRYTEINHSITISAYLENRFRDKSKLLRVISAVMTLTFFLFYTASGFLGSAKLFEATFNMNFDVALFAGALVVVGYTFLGGFLAVSLTDFVQGVLMFLTLLIIPFVLFGMLGGFGSAMDAVAQVNPDLLDITKTVKLTEGGEWITKSAAISTIGTISLLAWGVGYFGQPHILVRFMGIRSARDIPAARFIGVTWVVLSLLGAGFVGLLGIAYFSTPLADSETVLIQLAQTLLNPWVAGIVIAAIFAAIMSTVDSQLLVSSSALAEDFYKSIIRKNASDAELVWVSRLTVLAITIAAVLLARNAKESVMGMVSYAWAGFGSAFGPVILLSLFWKRMTRNGALAGMITGGVTVILWQNVKVLESTGLYELVPGFILGLVAIVVVSLLDKKPAEEIMQEFERAKRPLPNE
ncbi:sodium/proline symporter PutP [Numidum massiliense]|uniref:sodium/proline symporter PutP n=1 Tax=Numidum massiliense TaxID=1522315 RepID=UPI0006D59716|nr:sodium/proline symporter PutP [Numidum massiliense]